MNISFPEQGESKKHYINRCVSNLQLGNHIVFDEFCKYWDLWNKTGEKHQIKNFMDDETETLRTSRDGDKLTLYLFGDIDEYFGVSALDVIDAIQKETQENITNYLTVNINSSGGDVYEGIPIYNYLKNLHIPVTTEVSGKAFSISGLIMLAGKDRVMHENSMLMLHKASAGYRGNADEFRELANALDIIDGSIKGTFKSFIADSYDIDQLFNGKDNFLSADQALDAGLATEVIPNNSIVAQQAKLKAEAIGRQIESILNTNTPF